MAFRPVMICQHSYGTVSFHEGNTAAHLADYHSTRNPACLRMGTAAEHEAAGWDVSDYPNTIAC